MNERTRELFDAVTREPTNREMFDDAAQRLRDEEEWGPLVELSVHVAGHIEEPVGASTLLRNAGLVAEEKLENLAQALDLYNASLEGDPDGRQTLGRMRSILRTAKRWDAFIEVAEAEVERTEDEATRADLLNEMGEVLEEQLDDTERAMRCYQAAFDVDKGCLRALYAARRIYRQSGNWEMVAELLNLELESIEEPKRQGEIYQELGNVLLYDLKQPETARVCFDHYIQLRPDDQEMAAVLAELGGPLSDDSTGNASTGVETPQPSPTSATDPASGATGLAGPTPFDALQTDGADDPEAEISSIVSEPLPEMSDEALGTAIKGWVADAEQQRGSARRVLLIRAVRALNHLKPDDEALALLYIDAVRAEPGEPTLYLAVGRELAAPVEAKQQVAASLDALIEQNYEDRAAALTGERILFGVAHLDEARVADRKLRELGREAADDELVRSWQIQRFVETDKWRNLQQLLVEVEGGDSATARVSALRRMARMAEQRANKPTKALDFWRQVHMADKSDAEARRALLRLYRDVEKWNQYADVLRLTVEDLPEESEAQIHTKVEGLGELVQICTEHLKQDAMVVNLYNQILGLDPTNKGALESLVDKYESMRRWPDLVAILEKQAKIAGTSEEKIALNLRIGSLYLERFRNQAEAIKAYEAVLEEDPTNRDAIQALRDAYAKRREWEKLVIVERQLADLEEDPEQRLIAYRSIAENASKNIRSPEVCLDLWHQVLVVRPGDPVALHALAGIYEQGKQWNELVDTIDELVERVESPEEQLDLLQKSGHVLQDRIGDKERSAAVWRRALVLAPDNRRVAESLKKALIELSDWDGLTELFGSRDRWDELVRLLEGQVGIQKADEVRIDLLFRAAHVWREHIEQPDRAVRSLERILQIDPGHLRGAQALAPIYEENRDHSKLAAVVEVLLEHEAEPEERRRLMLQCAELNEAHLRRPDAAYEWIRRIVDEHPADGSARAELLRLAEGTDQWGMTHDDLQVALGRVRQVAASDEDARTTELDLLLCLARILDEQMGSYDEALAHYQAALSIEPGHGGALDAVEALFARMSRWTELLEVLDRKLELAETAEARKELLRKQGLIYEEQLDNADQAIERYRAIIEEDETDLDALEALHRLFDDGGRYEELDVILHRELQLANLVDEPERDRVHSLKMQIGLIALHALGRTQVAVDQFRDVVEQAPEHADAKEALEGLVEDAEHGAEVAAILEPIYVKNADWEFLVRCLEIQLAATAEVDRRFELLERIGQLHIERTADLERAFDAFGRAFRDCPHSEPALTQLIELARATDRFEDLASRVEDVLPTISDALLSHELLVGLAAFYEAELDDVDQAIGANRRALELQPEHGKTIDALEALYLRSEQWHELLAIYRRKHELCDEPEARETLLFQIASVEEDMLGDARGAIDVFVEILDTDDVNLRALQSLDRLYDQLSMWTPLANVIERQLAIIDDDDEEKSGLRLRLAGLYERELNDLNVAVDIYYSVIHARPDCTDAIAALERLVETSDLRPQIADMLEPVYETQDDWRKLIGVYTIQCECAQDDARQIELLHRIAELHQNRGAAPDESFSAYVQAFSIDPSNDHTLAELHRIAEALELWPELVLAYEERVEEIADESVAADIHKRIATIYLRELQEIELARGHYELTHQHCDADLEVISALEEIYFQTEQWEALVLVLLRKTSLTEEVEGRKDLLFRVSAIYEEMLEDLERAIGIFHMVLEVDPVDERALLALERIFLGLERWEALLGILHRKAELTDDPAAKKDIFYVVGTAYERELEDLPRAVDTYCTILEGEPEDLPALQALDRLYLRLEQWDSLLEVLSRQVELQGEVEERIDLQFRVAKLHEEPLDDVQGGVAGYQAILDEVPMHEGSLEALEALVVSDREAAMAAAVLEPVLQSAGAWDRVIGVWTALLDVTPDPARRTQLRLQIGLTHEEMLAQPEHAFAAYADAFREDAADLDTLTALERVSRETGAWHDSVQLIEAELPGISSESVARDLCLRVARIFEEEVTSNVDAIERYRSALEMDPDCGHAIMALDRLYQKEGMWVELGEILALEIERAEEGARLPLLLRLASLQENALDDAAAAVMSYNEALRLHEEEPESLGNLERLFEAGQEQDRIGEILEPIYLGRENWSRLCFLLESLLPYVEAGEQRMRGMHRLATINLENLKDSARGFDWYGRAFCEVPEDELTRGELARLAHEISRYEDLVAIYTEGLQNTQDLELLRSVSHEMARIHREQLADDEAAEHMYGYILEIDPGDFTALQGLDTLLEEQHRWPELVEILKREIEVTYEPEPQIELRFRLAQTHESRLADLDMAVENYSGILEIEPNHARALERLERIYHALERWPELYEIHDRQRDNAEEDTERAEICARMAGLAGDFLDRVEDAIDLWQQVLDLTGDNGHALHALEELYLRQERWRDLVGICERQISLPETATAQREVQLYALLGRVWGEHLQREENAIENWRNVLERDPEHEEAMWALRGLYERTTAWSDLAHINVVLLDRLADEDERGIDLLRQLGRLYQGELEQPSEAINAWSGVLERASFDEEAIAALEGLYTETEDWAHCVDVLERRVQITEDLTERIGVLFSVADMHERCLDDAGGAKRAYVQVLELQTDNVDASEQLERLYESAMQWEELVNLLLGRVELSDDPYSRAELLERTAKVFEEKLQSYDHAFLVLSRAFEEGQDDERLGPELQRLAAAGDKWNELIALYENVLQAMGSAAETVPIHLRVAQWYDEHFNTPEHAATHYQHVLALEPDNLSAIEALEALLTRYERWPEVAQVLRRRSELTLDMEDKRTTLEKMARILEEQLDQVDAAIAAYTEVVRIDDTSIDAMRALERLYAVQQMWPELVDVLGQQADVLDDAEEIVEIYLRVGELQEGRLGSPDNAIEAYRQTLSVDEHSLDAMQALEKLYTAQDRWTDLLDIYQMMLNVRTTPEDQLQIYSRMAIIREEELGDLPGTIDMYRKMLLVEPANSTAARALDRLYRDTEAFEDLADLYRNYLEAIDDLDERINYGTKLAALYREPLNDAHQAIESLTPILDIDPQHQTTLNALGELYAQVEDWPRCIDALSREAHLLTDRDALLDRQFRVGRIYQDNLDDVDQAERWYRGALDHDAKFEPALQALRGIYESREDWAEVVRILKMMEAATRSFEEKSKHLHDTGVIYDRHLDEHPTAIDYYEQAIDLHPENADAAAPLAAEYLSEERWERAEPMLDLLAAQEITRDLRELQELHFNLGHVSHRLHKDDKALKHYRQAYELDSTHLPTLRGMGELLFKREDWDRAFKIYQTILVHHRDRQSEEENVETFFRQGFIKLKVGERRKAIDFFRKALDLRPDYPEALDAIIDLYEKQSDWDNAIYYRRQQIRSVEEPRARFDSLLRIGDIFRENLRNVSQAVGAYNEALEAQPDSRLVLSKLLDLYENARQWGEAVTILTRLAEMEQDNGRKAKYFYAIAVIQRDELKDHFIAVRSFDRALDADPKLLKAFAAIDQILTKGRDYARQDRYYRKMLKRANDFKLDEKLVVNLARNLGEINRSRLKKYDEAIKAYKIALAKQPNDGAVIGILAELYEFNNEIDKAILQYYRMIELEPKGVDAYRQLRRLFMESKRYDEAWCVCQVLAYYGQASADERSFYEKYRSKALTQARTPLDNDQWARVYHPEESMLLARLFERLLPYTAHLSAVTHKQLRLNKRKDALNLTVQTPFNNVLNYVRQITRLTVTEAFRAPQGVAGLWNANMVASSAVVRPAVLLVGADVLTGRTPQELAFMLAKQLFLMSSQHYLASIESTYERRKAYLLQIVYTLTRLVNPQAKVPFSEEALLQQYNKTISQADRAEMAKLITKMSGDPRQHLNLSKWLEMVEHSANRLGLLLCNDLVAATKSIKNEPGQFSKAPAVERLRELVLYSLSPNYFTLRKELGLALG